MAKDQWYVKKKKTVKRDNYIPRRRPAVHGVEWCQINLWMRDDQQTKYCISYCCHGRWPRLLINTTDTSISGSCPAGLSDVSDRSEKVKMLTDRNMIMAVLFSVGDAIRHLLEFAGKLTKC
jgi:hypothetical protein